MLSLNSLQVFRSAFPHAVKLTSHLPLISAKTPNANVPGLWCLRSFTSKFCRSIECGHSIKNMPGNSLCSYNNAFLQPSALQANQKRNVIVASIYDGERKSDKIAIEKFRILGNGMWLRRQGGHDSGIWKEIMRKKGPRTVYRRQRHILCTNDQIKMLNKMVTSEWKQQRWTVTDPYAGYDDHVKFYYNPFNVPGVNKGKGALKREYMWQRRKADIELNNLQKHKNQKTRGGIGVKSHRQKPILNVPYFH